MVSLTRTPPAPIRRLASESDCARPTPTSTAVSSRAWPVSLTGRASNLDLGHVDTLGRCYYAAGDFENAVKVQSRAVELDPHSQQMKRQLALFQEALEKKKKSEK